MKAPLPDNEPQRLEALHAYNVLDTPPEQAYDDLTLLAAQVCQTPIAVISLVDDDRLWFKSRVHLSASGIARGSVFCPYAILAPDEILEIRDTYLDPRFRESPLVTGYPYSRFYAGAPLVTPDGYALGTLCVMDTKPRELSDEQKIALHALSRTVITQLELRRSLAAHRRAEEALQHLNASLEQKIEARTADLQREIAVRRESEQQYRTLADSGQALIWTTGTDNQCNYVNKAWLDFTGRSFEQTLGKGWIEDAHPGDLPHYLELSQSAFERQGKFSIDYRLRRHDGEYCWIQNDGCPRYNSTGAFIGYIGYCLDITERKAGEDLIQQLAHFDVLTGLPNRTLFTDRISHALSRAQRDHTQLALLFLDLDHFKNINDNLGHRAGDAMLVEVAKRLNAAIREEDAVSRLGGDEFILVLQDSDTNRVRQVAEKLLASVSKPFSIEQHEMVITPSIGIAMFPADGEDFDTLSKCADVAMYRAKSDGRNSYRFFTTEMQAHSVRRLQLENALRHALERNQLTLNYQPQIALPDHRIIGAEALLRWRHPEFGMVSPTEFIPIAEDSGQILTIGEWVLRTAIYQLKTWMNAGMAPMTIAVNLSVVQFRHSNLADMITQILEDAQLPAQYLELELTEGVAMEDPLGTIAIMHNLHQRGIRISIDDFGTGYSSLNYLKRFRVYKLKIDQSFVRDVTENAEDRAIVGAIIRMADALGLQTIAEGVETEGQLAFLRAQGCGEMQGFYFSESLDPQAFEAFVQKHRATSA